MNQHSLTKKSIGALLCQAGMITETDLIKALEEQKKTGKKIGETLIDMRVTTDFDIAKTLASQFGIQYVSLDSVPVEPDAVALIPEALARKYIGCRSGLEIKPVMSTRKEILDAIEQHYKLDSSVEGILAETTDIVREANLEIIPNISANDMTSDAYLKKKSQTAPIIRLVNLILLKAINERASDIHIEASRSSLSVRFRVDGILREDMKLPKWSQGALVSRIKILASLDIAERRLPQDGAIRVKLENKDIDLRISTIPTYPGEKVVIRILDTASVAVNLEGLAMLKKDFQMVRTLSQKRKGILLVTGPTGSAKTTTLYAIINALRS